MHWSFMVETHRPLRVLYVDHTAKLSGGEIALLNLLRVLDRSAVEPHVLLFSKGPLQPLLTDSAITTHLLEMDNEVLETRKESLGVNSIFKLKKIQLVVSQIWKVFNFIRENKIDIVHTNSLKSDVIAGISARLAGVPLIWHIRDRIDGEYLPAKVASTFKLSAKIIPDLVIANSYATLASLNDSQVKTNGHEIVVHDGTPLAKALLHRQMTKLKNGHTTVGIIGRISPWKGQHIFLQAAQQINRQFPEVRFKIVGSALFDEQAYEKEIRQLATDLNLNEVVEFTGFKEDVAQVLDELDIVVHASTTGEPFGQVIIEAMSAGRPVVATNGGGVPEIVSNQSVGLLVPMNNADAMTEALKRLISDPNYALTLGEAGRQHVLQNFTIEKTARGIEQAYSKLTSTAKQKRQIHS